jgi:hypothetical protein
VDTCDECGFEYRVEAAPAAGRAIVDAAGQLAGLVTGGTADARSRREPGTWSPLEYACHVRDVLLVQRERVLLARRRHRPALEPMGRDERVDHDGYAEQRPDDVARQLGDAAHLFANVLSRLGDEDWERPVVYGYPAPAERSLRWVAVHTLHEVHHHLLDVRGQLG